MAKTTWGIIGPGGIAHNFADGLKEAASGELIAIASKTADRRKALRQHIMQTELSRLAALWWLPRKILRLVERLAALAA